MHTCQVMNKQHACMYANIVPVIYIYPIVSTIYEYE